MIENTYTTFEQARALKELGFPQKEPRIYKYQSDGVLCEAGLPFWNHNIACPSLFSVQKWLWKTHFIWIEIIRTHHHSFRYKITDKWSKDITGDSYSYYNEPYEALQGGIDKCIEILKEKTND